MQFSQADLRDIVARSSRLSERLDGKCGLRFESVSLQQAETRLAEWKKSLQTVDARAFRARLAMSGHTEDSVKPLLGRVALAKDCRLPSWADSFLEIVSSIEITEPKEPSEKSAPFEEITLPFVLWAERRLAQGVRPAALGRCTPAVVDELKLGLQRWLTSIVSPTLISEFSAFRAVRQQLRGSFGGFQVLGSLPGTITRDHYREFIGHLQGGGLRDFFLEFPVLARLMTEMTELWVESETRFLRHLDEDWETLVQSFPAMPEYADPKASGGTERISWLRTDLSDRHHGGNTVKVLGFTSGRRCVYKPKSLELEAAFGELQAWINERMAREGGTLADLPFKIPFVITHSDHGWVEFIERKTCASTNEAGRFYLRAGMLTCLVYALEGTDYHNENLIAHGEYPVPIDQEGLFHHRGRFLNADGDEFGAEMTANSRIAHSVIRTAILPYWRFGEGGRSVDISALGGEPDQESMIKSPKWANVNTDQMGLVYEYLTSREAGGNVLFVGEQRQSANDYLPQLKDGFREMYDFLSRHRDALVAENGPIARFHGLTVRFIYRDTRIYFVLQRHALNTRFLRDGVDRSIQMEIIYRGSFNVDEGRGHPFLLLMESEQHAMERMDIPLLEPRTDRTDLLLETGKVIPDAFVRASMDEVAARISGLSEEDRNFQIELLTGSLLTRTVRPQQEGAGAVPAGYSGARLAAFPPGEFVREAIQVADQMAARAVKQDDEHTTWIGFVHVIEANRAQLQQLPNRLYDGSLGVAWFYAGLQWILSARFPGMAEDRVIHGYRSLAKSSVQPLLDLWKKGQGYLAASPGLTNDVLVQIGIGGGMGIGSAIYCLSRMSSWLDEPGYLDAAGEMAESLNDSIISSDSKYDLMFGAAGAILGLLGLWRARPDERVLARAIACGNHLLAKREPGPTGHLVWRASPGGPFLTGMSHGAAGFAHALFRLAEASGSNAFLEAAHEAVAYESAMYRPQAKNWPDFRASPDHSAKAPCWCSWCHGAPGIGLARLHAPSLPARERDIEAALETTMNHGMTEIDHLCCGNLGRADLMLEAGIRLGRPELVEEARTLASEIVVRARQGGGYRLGNSSAYSLSLFQGSAGIGYELLRMACPGELPDVLLWE